ncbi:MAG: polysaccharide biosynthesis tyrosine autokinase [Proteobacteria bacterium]|nr:polysaccharide biosynthesis tyrosine autokinase [Pseudomonadota bacterium]MBU1711013.1 polysaccharide biosynthesis tyrosine autokinase [Pseudomonadota bacterium]
MTPPPEEHILEEEISLRDIVQVFRKRKGVMMTFIFITMAIGLLGTLTATPYYMASVQMLIERNLDTAVQGKESLPYEPDFLGTQVSIIQSPNVVGRVVKKLGLDTRYRHFFIQQDSPSFRKFLISWIKETIQSIMPAMSSSKITNPFDDAQTPSDSDTITAMIQNRLTATPLRNTKIVTITYLDENPFLAQLVANALADAYMNEMLEIKMNSSNYAIKWMASKAEEEQKKLEESERKLQLYTREHDIVTLENKITILPQRLDEFSRELSRAQVARRELEEVYNQIQGAGDNLSALEAIPLLAANKTLQSLQDQSLKIEQHISELSKKYGPKHPLMIKAISERQLLLQEKKNEIQKIIRTTKNDYDLSLSREKNIQALLTSTKQELLNLKERFTQHDILKRDIDTNRVLYNALITRTKEQGASTQTQTINLWVVKKAELPITPSKPRKMLIMSLALMLGILGGIFIAFLLENLDNTIKSPEEVELRTNLPILGVINKHDTKNQPIETLVRNDPKSQLAENYRSIRSQVLLSSADHPPKSILFCSGSPGEGKTTTVANFASILALTNSSVLIIDCDMRKPRLHKIYEIPNSMGLSNYLTGTCDEAPIIAAPGQNFHIIPSGPIPPNPSELMTSGRMRQLLNEMKAQYDFVLFDSPPVMGVTDSQILSSLVDGTILVVRAGKTTWEQLHHTAKMFNNVKAQLLGVVLNGMKPDKGHGYYYYQGYYAYGKDEQNSVESSHHD